MRRSCYPAFMAALIGLQGLFVLGCDRGFSYSPEGWERQGKGKGWTREWPDLTARTWGIAGLDGSDGISVEFEITNRTRETIVVESARLETGKGSHPLSLAALSADASWRTIPPGEARRMPLRWVLQAPEPLPDRLGRSPRIILDLQEGGRPREIEVRYIPR